MAGGPGCPYRRRMEHRARSSWVEGERVFGPPLGTWDADWVAHAAVEAGVAADDADRLAADPPSTARLLGPYDPFLQLRDRSLLVGDAARQKDLWRVLGRPGGVLLDGEVAGTWRARKAGAAVGVTVEPWVPLDPPARRALEEQAERLATFRGLRLAGIDVGG